MMSLTSSGGGGGDGVASGTARCDAGFSGERLYEGDLSMDVVEL